MNKPVPPPPIPFIDLAAQQRRIGPAIKEAIARVLEHGAYILGPEVAELERRLSEFCGATHVISCSDGTDALVLTLLAKGVKPGQAVICPSFTYTASAEAIVRVGAVPIFADVEDRTFNVDPDGLDAALATGKARGLEVVGLMAVDLFGHPADYAALEPLCRKRGLWLLCDTAQSFGASDDGRRLGTFGFATTTSFFPAKPLGCYGDGGAIFTEDAALAEEIRSLRFHGLSADRTDHVGVGLTGRLDTIQAAVLIEKLAVFDDEIAARGRVAERYAAGLSDVAAVPEVRAGCVSTWAQYTIRVSADQRIKVSEALKAQGIPTAIYYGRPIHRQTAYRDFPSAGNGLPVTDRLSAEVISLPMHAYLDESTQDLVIEATRRALGS